MGTAIVAIIVLALVCRAVYSIVKNKKEGKCTCGSNCGSCSKCSESAKNPKQ